MAALVPLKYQAEHWMLADVSTHYEGMGNSVLVDIHAESASQLRVLSNKIWKPAPTKQMSVIYTD